MTAAARLAWTILVLCFAGWIASFVIAGDSGAVWVTVLRHGLEGAFVGGLCDAFAIWRMYIAIEKEYETLSREVSRFVVQDIVRPESLLEEIRAKLDEPETSQAFLGLIKEKYPSRRQLTAAMLDFWDAELRTIVLERMVQADLHTWFAGSSPENKVLHDPNVRVVLRHCLAIAVEDEQRTERLHELIVGSSWLANIGMSRDKLLRKLREAMAYFDQSPSGTPSDAMPLARDYALSYLAAWSALPEEERTPAVTALLDEYGPVVLEKAAELFWQQRESMVEYLASGTGISRHPFVDLIIRQLEPLIRDAPNALEDALQTKLRDLGGSGVRRLIERNTRPRLDGIQVNGTILGAVVGVAVGVLAIAASYAF